MILTSMVNLHVDLAALEHNYRQLAAPVRTEGQDAGGGQGRRLRSRSAAGGPDPGPAGVDYLGVVPWRRAWSCARRD